MTPPSDAPPRPTLLLSSEDFDTLRGTRLAELKERLLAFGRSTLPRLEDLGLELEVAIPAPLELTPRGRPGGRDKGAANAPRNERMDSLRVVFTRPLAARRELERLLTRRGPGGPGVPGGAAHLTRHADLTFRVHGNAIEVALEIPAEAWADRRSLRARLGDPARARELTEALAALPEQFAVGLASGTGLREARRARVTDLRQLLNRAERDGASLWLGWTVDQDLALRHADILGEQMEDALVALGPVYRLVAWTRDNDLLGLRPAKDRIPRVPAKRSVKKHRRPRGLPPDEGWVDERESEPMLAATPAPPAVALLPTNLGAPARGLSDTARIRRTIPRRSTGVTVDPRLPIEKGTKVLVSSGAFAGKVGSVQELDGKGGARVLLGLLATWLPVTDLVASVEGRERPVLGSSHRKPIPAR